jgi:hypothetical protein
LGIASTRFLNSADAMQRYRENSNNQQKGNEVNLCDNGHYEVVYEGDNCPACELKDDMISLKRKLLQLTDEIKQLKAEIEDNRVNGE